MWQRIHTELKPWSGTKLIGPDGTAIAVQGTTTVTIMVGDGSFIADVVVVDGLIAEVLLGLDFLEQHNCTIQAGEWLLTLKNGNIVIPLTSSDTVRKSPRMVVNLLQSVHIPPWSEIEVMAAGCGDVSSGVWIVEPATNGETTGAGGSDSGHPTERMHPSSSFEPQFHLYQGVKRNNSRNYAGSK